jgi:hypothetical protein
MDIKKLAQEQFIASGILNDPIAEKGFLLGFELGFINGNLMPQMTIKPAFTFRLDVQSNVQLRDLICMQLRINQTQYAEWLDRFFTEQGAIQRTYKDISEVNNHVRNWFTKQSSRIASTNNRTNKL